MARYRIHQIVLGPKLVSALGTTRRMRALARVGWGQPEIAARLGVTNYRSLSKITRQAEVHREMADKIKALYAELAWQDGPNYLAKANSKHRGWPGPMDWDDLDDPNEVPLCEIERAHGEALAVERSRQRNADRRADPARRQQERARQAAQRKRKRTQLAQAETLVLTA